MRRVLLVDDDGRLRQVLRRLMEASGFETAGEAGDGQEALSFLHRTHVDLVLTDCQMPRMDGISLVKALRQEGDSTPVIMLSGQEDPHIVVLAVKAGVNNYLPKPINPEVLLEKIQQTLADRPAA